MGFIPPIAPAEVYNQKIYGFFGKFGTGADAQISFIQGGIKPIDLHRITLISDIPNSERWPVRDLFQRDVDIDRVTNSIIPYFKDEDKVKFFNPLTLTLLPIDPESHDIVTKIPIYKKNEYTDAQGMIWVCYEAKGVYRFKHVKGSEQYGLIEWNDSLVKVVAIDGQHRLSALKRYNDDTLDDADFNTWTIPVVIFGLNDLSCNANREDTILNFIRNIFIYINTQAKSPNETRRILLSDESANAICVQALLDHYHQNDLKENSDKDQSMMPLLFFDWRGEEKNELPRPSPGAIKSIVEVRDWFREYVLGENFKSKQKISLGLQPDNQLLQRDFASEKLSPAGARELKKIFREKVMPGICYFLENFLPYKKYIETMRKLESKYLMQTDIARHAFHQLRFGTNRANNDLKEQVNDLYQEILTALTSFVQSKDFKSKFFLLNLDIGMRGILFAYGELHQFYRVWNSSPIDWLQYSTWFTENINAVLSDDWLSRDKQELEELLLHLTHNEIDSIINYRIQDAQNALGAYIVILVTAYGFFNPNTTPNKEEEWDEIWDKYSDILNGTLFKGYKKQMRARLKDDFINDPKGLLDAVKTEARNLADNHINRLESKINEIKN